MQSQLLGTVTSFWKALHPLEFYRTFDLLVSIQGVCYASKLLPKNEEEMLPQKMQAVEH